MTAIPPKTNIDGLMTAAEDLIRGAFRKGMKQGRYEQQQEYLASKEANERIRAERDALLADLTIACGDVPNPCAVCGHYRTDWPNPNCELIGLTCAWCWRGLQEGGSSCQTSASAASTVPAANQSRT